MWQFEEIRKRKADIRKLFDVKEVIYDQEWLRNQKKNINLYYMYRNVCKKEDEERIKNSGLRYDITVISSLMLGCEFVKTVGHYHLVAKKNLTYPEIYQVIKGESIFLIQKVNFENNVVSDVKYCRCKEGEIFIIPPNYGHITINPTNKELVIANWTASNFKSIYEPIKDMGGASYFFLEKGWVKNNRYNLVPELKETKGKKIRDMYNFVNNLKKLEFLKDPLIKPKI
jgi:glucose-6-phosphate isomerase